MRNTLDTLEIPNRIYALHILFNMDSTPIINYTLKTIMKYERSDI
jgi:hypothetical protein